MCGYSYWARAGPQMAMWSHDDPVTVFGGRSWAGPGGRRSNRSSIGMGASFSECRSYDIEVIAVHACDELAYTIAHERSSGPFAAR